MQRGENVFEVKGRELWCSYQNKLQFVIDVENVLPLLHKNHFSMTAEALEAKASDEKLYIRMKN